jgi:tRNA modification GTPase
MAVPPTIFALSSAPGRAGIAVVRVSGTRAGGGVDALAPPRPKGRLAALRRIRDPQSDEVLDEALVLFFAAPRTETGEDMAELHLHGGPAIVKAVLAALGRQPGCRLAEPGEFARRAFQNGKLDLSKV